jgi:molybdopterin synthase catalytic subunit
MEETVYAALSDSPLSIERAYAFVSDPAHGAVDIFAGIVRNHHEGRAVTGITYDAHPVLAAQALRGICDEAAGIWPGTKYYVAHYQGALDVGGISLVIAVGAAHRGAAFDACRYVIEEIKKRAPVWKKEHYPGGESAWLPGHSLADEAAGTVCCGKCHGG